MWTRIGIDAAGSGILLRFSLFTVVIVAVVGAVQLNVTNRLREREIAQNLDQARSILEYRIEEAERDWASQVQALKNLIVVSQSSDRVPDLADSLQAAATLIGGMREFDQAVLVRHGGEVIARFGRSHGFAAAADNVNRAGVWQTSLDVGALWRTITVPFSLPRFGAVDLVVSFPVDDAFLRRLPHAGARLRVTWWGQGILELDEIEWGSRAGDVQSVSFPWPRSTGEPRVVMETAPVALVTISEGITQALMVIFGVAIATWFIMGGWLHKNVIGPLVRLHREIVRSDHAGLSFRVQPEGVREIHALSSALNIAFDALETARQNLAEEERRFRDFAALTADVMWETDSHGSIVETWGKRELIPDIDKFLSAIGNAGAADGGVDGAFGSWEAFCRAIHGRNSVERALIRRDHCSGNLRYYSISAVPRLAASGSFIGFRGVIIDVTNLIALEGKLHDSEKRLLAVINAVPGVMYRRDMSDMTIIDVSSPVEAQTGYSAAEMIRSPGLWGERVIPADVELWRAAQGELSSSGAGSVRYRFTRRDGSVRWFNDQLRRTAGASEFVGVSIDVTTQVDLEERLRSSQKMDAIGKLTGGLAHEFNNVLGIVVSSLQLAETEGGLPLRAKSHIDAACKAALRGAGTTRALLAVANQQLLAPARREINSLLRESIDLVRVAAGDDTLLSVSQTEEQMWVRLDESAFIQCLVNLALNARAAMKRTDRPPELEIRLHPGEMPGREAVADAENCVVIEIADNGAGMTDEERERMFEPFFTTSPPGEGVGLGLSMVYGFISQSGGEIRVVTVLDAGTTVSLYLPTETSVCPEPATGPLPTGKPSETLPEHHCVAKGLRILVVDDESMLRDTLCEMLSILGCEPVGAASGADALEILARIHIDVMLSDITMPGISGIDLAGQVSRKHPDVRVVLTSGYSEIALDAVDFRFAFLPKPYTMQSVRAALGLVPTVRKVC